MSLPQLPRRSRRPFIGRPSAYLPLPMLFLLTLLFPSPGEGGLTKLAVATQAHCESGYAKLAKPIKGASEALQDYNPEKHKLIVLQYLSHLLRKPVPTVSSDDPFLKKGAKFIERGTAGLLRALVPIPLPRRSKEKVEKIFLKLWQNPNFEPSVDELATLEEAKALRFFEGRKKFLQANPRTRSARQAIALTAGGLLYANAAMALNQAREISENTITFDEFSGYPAEDEEGKPRVQLLVETTPFPHAALRVGHKVYSYGVSQMTARGLAEYLSTSLDASEPKQNMAGKIGNAAKKLADRSLRVTNINLNEEQIHRLQRDLELNVGKTYENFTMANDCATMIARALEENADFSIPTAIDALPSVSSTYLSLRRSLGDKRIGPTQMVVPSKVHSPSAHLARNTYIAMIEGKVALALLPYNYATRLYVDLTKGKDGLQYYAKEEQAILDELRAQTRESLEQELNSYIGGEEFNARLNREKDSGKRRELLRTADSLLESLMGRKEEAAEEIVNYSGAELADLVAATEQLETIARFRASWEKKTEAYRSE